MKREEISRHNVHIDVRLVCGACFPSSANVVNAEFCDRADLFCEFPRDSFAGDDTVFERSRLLRLGFGDNGQTGMLCGDVDILVFVEVVHVRDVHVVSRGIFLSFGGLSPYRVVKTPKTGSDFFTQRLIR